MKTHPDTESERDPSFDALRAAMAGVSAPRGVEKELMDAFAHRFPPRRWYHAWSPRQWRIAGSVASVALVAMLGLGLTLGPRLVPTAQAPSLPLAAGIEGEAPFVALESAERIEQEANPRMLEADVPRTALAALGLPITPENAGDSVRAELLVGADGSPLALRLAALP